MEFSVGDEVCFFIADLSTKHGTIVSVSDSSDFADWLFEIWVPDERKSYLVSNASQVRHSNKLQSYGA